MSSSLYRSDFYAWAKAQADALRRRGAGANTLDYDNLAEEVDDIGKSQLDAVESLVTQVLVHLIKLESSQRQEPKAHWRAEIIAFRQGWRRKLTHTIRRVRADDLEALHIDAHELAAAQLAAEEPGAPSPDASRRWTLQEALGE